MRKIVLLLFGALVLPAIVSSSPAEARYWGGGWRGGFGPGIGVPLIAGAVIGGLAASAYAYGPGPYGYYPGPYGYYPGPYGYYPTNAYQTRPNCEYGETYRCNYPAYGYRYGPWAPW